MSNVQHAEIIISKKVPEAIFFIVRVERLKMFVSSIIIYALNTEGVWHNLYKLEVVYIGMSRQ